MIYTSYFANLRNIKEDIVQVAICAICPYWYEGLTYLKLAPTPEMLFAYKRSNNEEIYTDTYTTNILGKLDAKEIEKELMEKSGGKDVVLLCYEKPSSFCHRNLVRNWLNDNGVRCEEY